VFVVRVLDIDVLCDLGIRFKEKDDNCGIVLYAYLECWSVPDRRFMFGKIFFFSVA
jgi:hypothetical protein